MKALKAHWISLRDFLHGTWPLILLVLGGFMVALHFVQPAPPRKVTISTGSDSGAYYRFAGRYAEILARNGITLEVKTSSGTVENLQRLQKGEVEVALVQGGVPLPLTGGDETPVTESGLRSIGSVFYEPVWVFYRADKTYDRLHQLAGKRIAIGPEGSGIRPLALSLLAANQITPDNKAATLLALSGMRAADALVAGEIDALITTVAPEAPIVGKLVKANGIRLMSFTQSAAYTRQFPFLSRLLLPEGAMDLVRNIPANDMELLGVTANLVVSEELHPAIVSLLLQAASEVHGKQGFFQKSGEFPAYKDTTLPLSEDAAIYFKSGPPFLQRFLPFWIAVWVDRVWVMLLPVIALLLPLFKIAPLVYSWRIRNRIYRCYGALKFLENEINTQRQAGELPEAQRTGFALRLDKIELEANALKIPLAFSDLHYTLRQHIHFVRDSLGSWPGNAATTSPAQGKIPGQQ